MSWYEDFLKKFFHDPIDKPFDIPSHEQRAKEYAGLFNIAEIEEGKYSDQIASCMERSLLPKGIKQDFNEIRHPLCEGEIKLDTTINNQECMKEISNLLKEISEYFINLFHEQKAFLIWRNLLEELIEKVSNKDLKKLIPILPADTRTPDHSIWEHLKVTTAIKVYESYQNNSLLLFTIGPVQSFISQARKAQDFYMGSFILSYLTFIAIRKVVEQYGPTSIIYPDLYKQPLMDWYLKKDEKLDIKCDDSELKDIITLPTIPNRFVGIIGTTNKDRIYSLVNEIKEEIRKEIESAIDNIIKELDLPQNEKIKSAIINQLSDFPQIYWVAIPWRISEKDVQIEDLKDFFTDEKIKYWQEFYNFAKENAEHSPNIGFLYQLLYTAVEKSLGARKNLREFNQLKKQEENVLYVVKKMFCFIGLTENQFLY